MDERTLNEILGIRTDKETTDKIKKILTEEPGVNGAYDLIVYNYGPDRNLASVHLELPDTMTVSEVDALTRKLEAAVYGQTGIILTGASVYSYNTGDSEAARIRDDVREKVLAHEWALEMHGFYVDLERRSMRFDVVMSFDIDPREGLQTVYDEIRRAYPDYALQIIPDVDVSVSG